MILAATELPHGFPHLQTRLSSGQPRINGDDAFVPSISDLKHRRSVSVVSKYDLCSPSEFGGESWGNQSAAVGEVVVWRLNVGNVFASIRGDGHGRLGSREEKANALRLLAHRLHLAEIAHRLYPLRNGALACPKHETRSALELAVAVAKEVVVLPVESEPRSEEADNVVGDVATQLRLQRLRNVRRFALRR